MTDDPGALAGVSTDEYTTLSVTLSPESDPTWPGDRLFVGQLAPAS